MDEDTSKQILSALGALDEKVGAVRSDIAGLKKTDEHLASEVHRIGEEQRRQGRELQELRAETLRTFESERHAAQQTVKAITKHVDEAAQAFHAKADKIDRIEAETAQQSAELAKQTQLLERLDKVAAHPMVRRLAYAIAAAVLTYLTAKGIR